MLLRRQLRNFYGSGWFHHNVAVAVFTVLSDAIMPHASERTVPALQSTTFPIAATIRTNCTASGLALLEAVKRAGPP